MKKIIRLTESDIAKIVKKKIDALKPVVDDITDKYGDRRFKQIEGGQFKPSKKFKKTNTVNAKAKCLKQK